MRKMQSDRKDPIYCTLCRSKRGFRYANELSHAVRRYSKYFRLSGRTDLHRLRQVSGFPFSIQFYTSTK